MRKLIIGILIILGSLGTHAMFFRGMLPAVFISDSDIAFAQKAREEAPKLPEAKKIDEKKQTSPQIPHIPWETIALVISILSGVAAITGFSLTNHNRKRAISKYMEKIDSTFANFKWQSKQCESELYSLKSELEDSLKKGKVDESLYELLTKRIDKYLKEIQDAGIPDGLKN